MIIDESIKELESPFPDINAKCLKATNIDYIKISNAIIDRYLSYFFKNIFLNHRKIYLSYTMTMMEINLHGSPFSRENIKAIIVKGVSTETRKRKPWMFRKINQKIEEIIKSRMGNIGIFCPSYKIIDQIDSVELGELRLENITRKYNRELFKEDRLKNSDDNAEMINRYKNSRGGILLGVLGGRNSEGEDFPGGQMETVVIVGVPFLPRNDLIVEKENYYDSIFPGRGKYYAYIEPSFRKSNQAAGRPIRSIDDRGVIIFLDYRYEWNKMYLSEWINNYDVLSIIDDKKGLLEQDLKYF